MQVRSNIRYFGLFLNSCIQTYVYICKKLIRFFQINCLNQNQICFDIRPKKCPKVDCNEVCEERRTVSESDKCGCAVHKCVPRTDCPGLECGKCEVCKRVSTNDIISEE